MLRPGDLAKVLRAVRVVRDAGGAFSIHRALIGQGLSAEKIGPWIEAGRALLADGWLPDHRRCESCGGLEPSVDRATKAPRKGACLVCGAEEWEHPTPEERALMLVARADERADELIATKAGRRLRSILDSADPKLAGAQARLIPFVLEAVNPERFGRIAREGSIEPAAEVRAPEWAVQLSPEDLERLPPAVIAELQEIVEEQAALERRARELISRALEGAIEVVPLALEEGVER